MALFLCRLDNNADFAARVVVISAFGQGDRVIPPLSKVVTQFQAGRKVMITFRDDTGELVEFHGIAVVKSSAFAVFPTWGSSPAPMPVDEGTPIDPSEIDDEGLPIL